MQHENLKKSMKNFFSLFIQGPGGKKKFMVEKTCFDNTVSKITLAKKIIKKKCHYNLFRGSLECLQNKKRQSVNVSVKIVAMTDCTTETCFQRESEPLLFFQKTFKKIWLGLPHCDQHCDNPFPAPVNVSQRDQYCDTFPAPGALYTHDGRLSNASLLVIPMEDCGSTFQEWKWNHINASNSSIGKYRTVIISIMNKLEKMNSLGILHGGVCDYSLVMRVDENPDDWFLIDVGSSTLVNGTAARLLHRDKSFQSKEPFFHWREDMTVEDIEHFDVLYFLISELKSFNQQKNKNRAGFNEAKSIVKGFIRKAWELLLRKKKQTILYFKQCSTKKFNVPTMLN